jgi:hypothetical protein
MNYLHFVKKVKALFIFSKKNLYIFFIIIVDNLNENIYIISIYIL